MSAGFAFSGVFTTSPSSPSGHPQGHWQAMGRLLSQEEGSWRQMPEVLRNPSLQLQAPNFFMRDFCLCLRKNCATWTEGFHSDFFFFFVLCAHSTEAAFMHPCTSQCRSALEVELNFTNTTSLLPSLCIRKRRNVSHDDSQDKYGQIFQTESCAFEIKTLAVKNLFSILPYTKPVRG